jgi:hypothetical protein
VSDLTDAGDEALVLLEETVSSGAFYLGHANLIDGPLRGVVVVVLGSRTGAGLPSGELGEGRSNVGHTLGPDSGQVLLHPFA